MIFVVLALLFLIALGVWCWGLTKLWTTSIVGVRWDDAPDNEG